MALSARPADQVPVRRSAAGASRLAGAGKHRPTVLQHLHRNSAHKCDPLTFLTSTLRMEASSALLAGQASPALSSADAHSDTGTLPQQAPSTPMTPLQLRQWQRAAQRSVRLALTAFKAARTKMQEAAEEGTTAATQLTNSVLTAQYVPSMQLPQSLEGIQGLKAAAASKLKRRQQQHLEQLAAAVQQVSAGVHAMELALADVQAQLGAQQQGHCPPPQQVVQGPAVSGTPSAAAQQAAPCTPDASPACAAFSAAGGAPQCHRMPVFHILALPEALGMLQRVLQQHQHDLQLKRQVLQGFTDTVASSQGGAACQPGSSTVGGSSKQASAGDAAEGLRKQLTVLITCWMTKPHVDDDEQTQLLQVLTDEMTGF